MFGKFVHRYLPLLLFALPVVAVNAAYLVSSITNHVPDCITYLMGCTSISSTGRVMPQKAIFLAGMIPTAVLTVAFWTYAESWLTGNGKHGVIANRSLLIVGTIASVFLLVYVTTLGIPGEYYELTRKFAVLIYFGFTFIAQLLLIQRLLLASEHQQSQPLHQLAQRLKYFCAGVIMFGIAIVPISLLEDPVFRKKLENIVEWNFAVLIYLYFLLVFRTWKDSAQTASMTVDVIADKPTTD